MKGDIWIECDGREAQKMAYNDKHEPIWLTKYTPDKPKVRLEEFTQFLLEDIGVSKDLKEAAKSICTHLGVELESEQPDWERELRDITQQHYSEKPNGRDLMIAKAMFEAGQAFERKMKEGK